MIRGQGWLVVLALLAVACGPNAEVAIGGAGGTGTTGGTATGGAAATDGATSTGTADTGVAVPPPEGCTCKAASDAEYSSCEDVARGECVGEELCETIVQACPRPNQDAYSCQKELVYDGDAVDCALAALRDRTPGTLTTYTQEIPDCSPFHGCASTWRSLTIVADGTLFDAGCSSEQAGSPAAPRWYANVRTLREPAYFDDCLALEGANAKFRCMIDGLVDAGRVCD